MAKRGRPRKQGKRTKSGRLSRAGARVLPNERVQEMQARFGNHYSSALGRAFAAGLLGDGTEAKTRLDAGNKFVQRYKRIIGGDAYTCPLDQTVRGESGHEDNDRDKHQEAWLFAVMDRLDEHGLRPWLDQLIHKTYTDGGPYWLDALLAGEKSHADKLVLESAILALDMVAGTQGDSIENKTVDIPLHMCHARS